MYVPHGGSEGKNDGYLCTAQQVRGTERVNIRVPLPPTYVREVWDNEKANIEHIKKAISNFDCNKASENLSVDEKVDFLHKTLLNIFRN